MAGNIFQIKFACSSRRETLVKKLKSPELSVRRSVCYTYNCIPNWNCLSVIECAVVFNELSVRHLFPPKHATLRNSKLIDRLHSISMLFGRIDRMSHASIYHHPVVTSSSSSSSVTPLRYLTYLAPRQRLKILMMHVRSVRMRWFAASLIGFDYYWHKYTADTSMNASQ